MAPKLSEDDIDDIIYFARANEVADLNETLSTLSSREGVSAAEIIIAARDEGKSTCLHMATGNGNIGIQHPISSASTLIHASLGLPADKASYEERQQSTSLTPVLQKL